jgi:D-lactate dehydrogenase
MKVVMFSTRSYEQERYQTINQNRHSLRMISDRLDRNTLKLAQDAEAIIVFVSDDLSADILTGLAEQGVRLIICRSAGVDHVDLIAAKKLGLTVANCPQYSPAAVAEFAVGLLLALNRKIIRAHQQVQEHNFTVDALLGTELKSMTVGIIGTGHIGTAFARILSGFGTRMLGLDPIQNPECVALGVDYCSVEKMLREADAISLHAPLLPSTTHIINRESILQMKPGMLLVNTGRGALVDTPAIIEGIESGRISGYAADVYEYERGVFFEDYSNKELNDALLLKLLEMPEVIITPHQAFFTETALQNMANNVFENLDDFERSGRPKYLV